jgi:hypothetical protein
MDLGAARLKDNVNDVIDIVLKPGYSPVEQYDNSKNFGPWTDIYSLGATFYMMITGVKPEAATNRKIGDTLIPPSRMDRSINENLSNAIIKSLAIDIHMRFEKVADFLSAINGDKKVKSLTKEKKHRRVKRFSGIAAAFAVLIALIGVVAYYYAKKAEEGYLPSTTISVWYSAEGTQERNAMQYIADDFKQKFPKVRIELRGIPEEQYADEITAAAKNGQLPDLFESTDLDGSVLANAQSVEKILGTEQAEVCLFLEQYRHYYDDTKRLPLAIEVPVAYVITSGKTSTSYSGDYFSNIADFDPEVVIAADSRYRDMIARNFGTATFADSSMFMDNANNTSPILLSSTSILKEVRSKLTGYEKKCVFLNAPKIYCDFTYEWSIGAAGKNELAAAERFLSWMLGNRYQSILMIKMGNDGKIPINQSCFGEIETHYLLPICDIYERFVFDTKD